MAITRKEFLKLGLVAGGAGLALSCGASASLPGGRGNATTGNLLRSAARLPKPFLVPLPVGGAELASNTRYRFRILNASNARRYRLALDPEPSDGAPLCRLAATGDCLGHPSPTARSPSPRRSVSTW